METAKGVNQPMDESTSHPTDDQMDETWDESTDETWDESTDETWDESADETWDESTDETWDGSTGEPESVKVAPPTQQPEHQPPDRSGWRRLSRRNLLWIGGGIVAALVVGNYLVQGLGGKAGPSPTPSPQPSTTPVPNGTSAIGLNAPIILLNPGIVKPGTAVTINGYGFAPQSVVDLAVKQGNGSGKSVGYVKVSQAGAFATTFDVPAGMIAGPFTVEAHQRNSTTVANATGSVSAGAAFVKMGAVVGKIGDVIGWSGNGFAPGETVNVYWNALGGQPLATYHADQGGGIKATVQVPFSAIGQNSFIFMGTQSQAPVTAPFLVLKLYPNVKPSTYAIHAADPISFSGSGFGPNERVLIFLNSTNGAPLAVAQADAHGAFKNAGTMVIPFTFKGKQTILFIGEQSRSLTQLAFSVLPYLPHAQASTYGGMPGTTISFYAYDFARNEVVHVYTGRGSGGGGTEVACFRTNGQGAAGAQGSYSIPADAQGKLTFTLVGASSGASTTAVVTVTPSNVPIQVPPQPPFKCPLDQPNQAQPQQPQAPAGGAPGGGQVPQQPQAPEPAPNGAQGDLAPSSSTGAPQAQRAHPAQAASLLLFAALVSVSGVTASRTSSDSVSVVSPSQTKRSGNAAVAGHDAASSQDQWWVRVLGLLWLIAVVMLSVVTYARARISKKGVANGLRVAREDVSRRPLEGAGKQCTHTSMLATPTASTGVAPTGGADVDPVPRVPGHGRRVAREVRGSLQRLPVVLADGELGLVPQVAGVTGQESASRTQNHANRLLMQIADIRLNGYAQPYGLFAVVDGMGADSTDREASSLALRIIAEHVASRIATDASAGAIAFPAVLTGALTQANSVLYQRNTREHAAAAMTVTAALLAGDTAYIVNVGDSRTYLYSPLRGLRQVTMDHSIVAALVATELLPPEATYTHPRRSQIYRCLGRQSDVRVDQYQVMLEPDDRVLLCSDGLWAMVRDPQIEGILRASPDPHQAAEHLIATAHRNGARDSASVIVARTLHDYVIRAAQPTPNVQYANEEASDMRDMVSPGHAPDRG